jgi:hypothetical protein
VIASNQSNPIRISYFERQQQEKGFHRIIASVHKVAEEQIVLVRTLSTDLEELY